MKLVSEVGVGTVAAGVAKAKADHVTIAGHDGGTGASPVSSIKHAGTPWELGLAETQQTLVLNRLRGRIAVQVDGQMKTGRDVVVGALLGADEFGFATAPLVATGCIMMRKCHLNTCPVGIATQNPELRRKFTGAPEHVVNYFFFVAEEVRELMAKLGIRRFDDLIGRSDLLDKRRGIEHWKARGLDFSRIFHQPTMPAEVARRHCEVQDHGLGGALDHRLIADAAPAIERRERVRLTYRIRNANRSVGAMLSGAVARKFGHGGLPDDAIHVSFEGTAGQSFGAFLAHGITFELQGATNDYVGKGLSGGRIVVYPDPSCPARPEQNIVIGNTVMYGAIAGEAYFRGVAGERFCVRNSGASAVVEGTGDHGCEYMTGGTVVVLGRTGRNFAAGMSGGIAYVYDDDGTFATRCNGAMVALEPVLPEAEQTRSEDELVVAGKARLRHAGRADEAILRDLVERHLRYTGSTHALAVLDDWDAQRRKFVKVFPHEYRRALTEMHAKEAAAKAAAAARERRQRNGQDDRLHGVAARPRGHAVRFRARAQFPRVHPCAHRRPGVDARRALHGLRHPVLPERLPGQQRHPRLERPRVPPPVAGCARRSSFDEQLPGVHGPHLSCAMRSGVHAQHQRRSRRYQVDRALHHRQGLGGRLGRASAAVLQDREARRGDRLGPGGARVRAAAGARRPRRRRLREGRPDRRPAPLRHSRFQDGETSDRPADGADVDRGRRLPAGRPRRQGRRRANAAPPSTMRS